MVEDDRIEWIWQPAPLPRPRQLIRSVEIPQPTCIFDAPLRLAILGDMPLYQGQLLLLAGPHRIESGWWDRTTEDGVETTRHVARDYWVAFSEHAGILSVLHARLATDETRWFVHGHRVSVEWRPSPTTPNCAASAASAWRAHWAAECRRWYAPTT